MNETFYWIIDYVINQPMLSDSSDLKYWHFCWVMRASWFV